jgi:Fe-S-cluster-containing hydrogenase component 2
MFLLIRPDLCLGCNECTIALACPHGAVERVPREPADDYRGDYWFDTSDYHYGMGEDA